MTIKRTRLMLAGGAALATMGGAGSAIAAPTAAGTIITNQAQATYTVNNVPATASSSIASFVVDRKVAFTTVSAQATTTKVSVGQVGAVTTFTVTNTTNGTQDFRLDPDQQNLSLGVLPGTDNFDVVNMKAYVDLDRNGQYDPAIDTAQYIDELGADMSATVFIVADVGSPPNPDRAFVSLHVIAAAGGAPGTAGDVLVPTDLALLNREGVEDIVFADDDSDGAALGDVARNGQGRAYAAYEIGTRTVALSIAKTARVVSDGVSVGTPARALPGAVVEYCLTVTNATPLVPAGSVVLSDVVPDHMTYFPGSITVGGIGAAGTCVLNGFAQRDDGTNTTGPYTGSYDAATRTIRAGIPTVPGGASLSASFRATID